MTTTKTTSKSTSKKLVNSVRQAKQDNDGLPPGAAVDASIQASPVVEQVHSDTAEPTKFYFVSRRTWPD